MVKFQFCLGALGVAVDAKLLVIFLVWNNHGYQEIERAMVEVNINPVGVRPSAPDYIKIAEAYGLPSQRLSNIDELPAALSTAKARTLSY